MIRKTFFWLHLAAGLVAGLVVAVMSFTGAAIAFEKELVAWAERDVRRVETPADAAQRILLADLVARTHEQEPETRPTAITVFSDPSAAVAITFGREKTYYANPYTGDLRKPAGTSMRDFMRSMESWHRFLGLTGDTSRPVGKAITGVCNLAFLFLAISGLYLWWPRNWSWRGFKAVAVFNFRLVGKARDFNWHNSLGLWTAPILIVLTLTAVPMSYRWGNNLVYRLTGNEPPPQSQGPGSATSGATILVSTPEPGAKPLTHDALLARVQATYPGWTEITFRLGNNRVPGGGQRRAGQSAERRPESGEQHPRGPQAVTATVRTEGQWPLFSNTTLALDPFTGEILKTESFADQNAGRRLRSWTRFIHTGEGFGTIGKTLALLASLSALVLCWTGIALSWRRFFRRPVT